MGYNKKAPMVVDIGVPKAEFDAYKADNATIVTDLIQRGINAKNPPQPLLGISETANNNTERLEEIFAYLGKGTVYCPQGRYPLEKTCVIPVDIVLLGDMCNETQQSDLTNKTVFEPIVGGNYTENYLFFVNLSTIATNTPIDSAINNRQFIVEDIFINNTLYDIDGTVIHGFKYACRVEAQRIYSYRIGKLFSIYSGDSSYIDRMKFRQIVGTRRGDLTSYLIELPMLGDGYEISQIVGGHTDVQPSDNTSKGLYVRGQSGIKISGLVGGNHTFKNTRNYTLSDSHLEGAYIENIDSSGTIRNNYFFNVTAAIDATIQLKSEGGQYNNRYTLTIEENEFALIENFKDGWGANKPDIKIHSHYNIILRDNRRVSTFSGSISTRQYTGILLSDENGNLLDTYNNYSHIYSPQEIRINLGKIITKGTTLGVSGAFTGISTVAGDSVSTFKGDSGTYYYQAQVIIDPARMLGSTPTGLEKSLTLDYNDSIPKIVGSWNEINHRGIIVRLYRGTTSGVYDKYVDIPLVMCNLFYDNGLAVNGIVWKDRPPGAIDTLNNRLCAGNFEIINNVVRVQSTHTESPDQGTWIQGDFIEKINSLPSVNNNILMGWKRLTSGSGHVAGTDWQAIYLKTVDV